MRRIIALAAVLALAGFALREAPAAEVQSVANSISLGGANSLAAKDVGQFLNADLPRRRGQSGPNFRHRHRLRTGCENLVNSRAQVASR